MAPRTLRNAKTIYDRAAAAAAAAAQELQGES